MFQLAIDRGQADENPFRRVSAPRVPKQKVRVYTQDECKRMANAAGHANIATTSVYVHIATDDNDDLPPKS